MRLEDEYIKEQKAKEREEFMEERKRLQALGVKKLPMTEEEIRAMLKKRSQKTTENLMSAREAIKQSIEGSETPVTAAPLINEDDIDFLA